MKPLLASLPSSQEASSQVTLIGGGDAAFRDLLSRIYRATFRIEVRAFLWRDDSTGNAVGQALLDAANRGIEVIIYKDRVAAVYEYSGGNGQSFFHKRISPGIGLQALVLGSAYAPTAGPPRGIRQRRNPLAAALEQHPRIQLRHRQKRFDHSKIFVFDETSMVLGSMGIGDNHRDEWVDVMVAVDGAEHVARLRNRLEGIVPFDPERSIDFLVHSVAAHSRRESPLAQHRLEIIGDARSSVTVEMAYFGDERFTEALAGAIDRGVKVTVVTSAADVLGHVNLATCNRLLRLDGGRGLIEISVLPRMVHSKIVLVDDRVCDVGSANFTPLSHSVFDEINVYVVDPSFGRAMKDLIGHHRAEGRTATEPLSYRRLQSSLERMVMAYHARRPLWKKPGATRGSR